jgi:hypothetical protein
MMCLTQILVDDFMEVGSDAARYMLLLRGSKSILFYRIIKYNGFAVRIMNIAERTLPSYLSLVVLMFIMIMVYALFAVEIFGGKFDQEDAEGQLHNFNDPIKSWISVFNIATNDEWYAVLVLGTEHS